MEKWRDRKGKRWGKGEMGKWRDREVKRQGKGRWVNGET